MLLKRKRTIRNINVKGRVVLVRCDFNVSLNENGEVEDDLRIRQVLPTIRYLLKKKAKVVLLSHFSSKGQSAHPVKKSLSGLLKTEVGFVDDCVGEKVLEKIRKMEEREVLLLENVRMHKEEEESSTEFGKELASLADFFVNDAFSVSHRSHASLTQIPLFIPAVKGFLMEREIKLLGDIRKNSKKSVAVIIGGVKIKSKISVVNYFLKNAEHVLLGGKIANMVLIVRKIAFNLPWPSDEIEEVVKKIDYTSTKLHIPVDVVSSPDNTGEKGVREIAPGKISGEEDIFDIGPETRKLYGDILKEAEVIIWAGPLGFSEKKPFEGGTKEVGEMVAENKKAIKIVGGGDTIKAFQKFNLLEKMDLVSYGGGAMLAYLSEQAMPGIEALEENQQ